MRNVDAAIAFIPHKNQCNQVERESEPRSSVAPVRQGATWADARMTYDKLEAGAAQWDTWKGDTGDSGTRQPVKQTPEKTGTVVHTETFNLITITMTITIAITIMLMIMLAQESKAIIEMKSAEAKSKDSTQFINIQLMCHKQVQHSGRGRGRGKVCVGQASK